MSDPTQAAAPTQVPSAPPSEPGPDLSRLNRAGQLMKRLSGVGPDDPSYNEAQALFQSARREYLLESKKHHDFYAQQAQNQSVEAPDLGAIASARIGVGQGLGGLGGGLVGMEAGGALGTAVFPGPGTAIGGALGGLAGAFGGQAAVKPLTELLSGAPAEDVRKQWATTVGLHPDANLAGQVGSSVLGGVAVAAANKWLIGKNLVAEKLAQAQTQSKLMAQKLVDLEQKAKASQAVGSPLSEANARSALSKIGLPEDLIESAVNTGRQGGLWGDVSQAVADAEPVHPDAIQAIKDFEAGKISGGDLRTALDVAAGRTPIPEAPQVPGTMGPVKGGGTATAGYAGNPRGIDVTGARPNPAVAATQPSLSELSGTAQAGRTADVIAQERAAARGLAPQPGTQAPSLPKDAELQQYRSMLRQVQRDLGRTLRPEEKAALMQKVFGAARPSPGHPLFFGDRAPTQ